MPRWQSCRFLLCLLFHVARCPPWPPEEWRDDDKVKPLDLDRIDFFKVPRYKYKEARNKPRMNRAVMLRLAKLTGGGAKGGGMTWHDLMTAQHAGRANGAVVSGTGSGDGKAGASGPPGPKPLPPPKIVFQEVLREGPIAAQVAKARRLHTAPHHAFLLL